MALAQGCYYRAESTVFKTSRLELAEAKPIHVGSRIDLAMEGRAIVATATPMCSDARVGEYVHIYEKRRERKKGRGQYIASFVVGSALMVAGLYLLDTSAYYASYSAIPAGAFTGVYGGIGMLVPSARRTELPAERYPAAVLQQHTAWKQCGAPEPVVVGLLVTATHGSDTWEWAGPSSIDGNPSLPAMLDSWSASCGVELDLDVTIHSVSMVVTDVLASRSADANLDNLGGDYDRATLAMRHPAELEGQHFEVGQGAGRIDPIKFRHNSSWSYKFEAKSQVQPEGDTDGARFARRCLASKQFEVDRKRAEVRRQCIAPKETAVRSECRASCTNPAKTKPCDVDLEVCKATFGPNDRDCASHHQTCVGKVGQDESSISSCTSTCAERVFDTQCPR